MLSRAVAFGSTAGGTKEACYRAATRCEAGSPRHRRVDAASKRSFPSGNEGAEGRGTRLFEHVGTATIDLEPLEVIEAPEVTHLRYRLHA